MPDSHSTVNINIDWLRAAPASLLFFPAPEGITTLNVTLTTNPHGTPYPTPESVGATPESLPGHAIQTVTEGLKRRLSNPQSPSPIAKHPRTSSPPLPALPKDPADASMSSRHSAGHTGPSKPYTPLPTFSSRDYRQANSAAKLRDAAGTKKRSTCSPMGQVASDGWFRDAEVIGEIPPSAKSSNRK